MTRLQCNSPNRMIPHWRRGEGEVLTLHDNARCIAIIPISSEILWIIFEMTSPKTCSNHSRGTLWKTKITSWLKLCEKKSYCFKLCEKNSGTFLFNKKGYNVLSEHLVKSQDMMWKTQSSFCIETNRAVPAPAKYNWWHALTPHRPHATAIYRRCVKLGVV